MQDFFVWGQREDDLDVCGGLFEAESRDRYNVTIVLTMTDLVGTGESAKTEKLCRHQILDLQKDKEASRGRRCTPRSSYKR